jgi:hypothetical protein
VAAALKTQIEARNTIISKKEMSGSLSSPEKRKHKRIKSLFGLMLAGVNEDDKNAAEVVSKIYNDKVAALKESTKVEQDRLHNLFVTLSTFFGDESNEMLVAVTELTLSDSTARFFNTFGSEDYDKYNALLMVQDRKEDLRKEIDNLV